VRGHDTVGVGLGRRERLGGPAVAEAVVDQGVVVVGGVAVGVEADGVDPVLAVPTRWVVGGREAPVAVTGLLEAMLHLGRTYSGWLTPPR
jgi:hypothetical protein